MTILMDWRLAPCFLTLGVFCLAWYEWLHALKVENSFPSGHA